MKSPAIAVVGALLVGGCSTSPFTGEEKTSNTEIGAGIGSAVGAASGALIGGDRKAVLIGAGIGALAGGGIGLYMDKQESDLRKRLRSSGVSVTRIGNDIILNMPDNITFDVDSSQIKPQFYEVLNSIAIVLNEYNQSIIDVIGHTDSDGSFEHNQQLSEARSASVSRYLVSQLVDGRRLETRGVGETQPIASNNTAAGKAQNRRVEIKIVPLAA